MNHTGEVGEGGVIFGPDGDLNFTYSWNLGIYSNNMAEALALWQGLNQALLRGIQDLTIVGDSKLIIHLINTQNFPSSNRLCQVLLRISMIIPIFRSIDFFHVLRMNNGLTDKATNEAIPLSKGVLKLNDDLSLCHIP